MIPTVAVTRYVTPLREGGSLPGIVEADDLGTYVCKFRGAGQGVRVLVAEVVVAGLAERIGLRTPRLVALDLDPEIARYEADEEVQDLLNASAGLNLGVDFLPGSFGYDGARRPTASADPARVLWLDAFCANVDRSWRNPNLLLWHGDLWVIDHGAASTSTTAGPAGVGDPAAVRRPAVERRRPRLRRPRRRAARRRRRAARRCSAPTSSPRCWPRCPTPGSSRCPGAEDPAAVRAAYVAFLTARLGTAPVAAARRRHERRRSCPTSTSCCAACPRVDREEFVNVGVVLHCQAGRLPRRGLARRPRPAAGPRPADRRRPGLRGARLRRGASAPATPRRERPAAAPVSQRFGFLKAPRSTVLQPGPVHGGVTADPARQLERLLDQLVG